jgi:hypothetical protein
VREAQRARAAEAQHGARVLHLERAGVQLLLDTLELVATVAEVLDGEATHLEGLVLELVGAEVQEALVDRKISAIFSHVIPWIMPSGSDARDVA